MKIDKMTIQKYKKYLKTKISHIENENSFKFYYFKNLDNNYSVNENTPINSFVYSAKDIASGDRILYKILSFNKKKFVNVISKDYGFSSFYLNALALIPKEILDHKHSDEVLDDDEIIKKHKEKRKNKEKI